MKTQIISDDIDESKRYLGNVILYRCPVTSFVVKADNFIANSCHNLKSLSISNNTKSIELIDNPLIKLISISKFNYIENIICDCKLDFEKFERLKNLTYYGDVSWIKNLTVKTLCLDSSDVVISDMPNLKKIIFLQAATADIYRCPKLVSIYSTEKINVKIDGDRHI